MSDGSDLNALRKTMDRVGEASHNADCNEGLDKDNSSDRPHSSDTPTAHRSFGEIKEVGKTHRMHSWLTRRWSV